jgi:prophage antirepressor-like protein
MDVIRLFKINGNEYTINIRGEPENPLFQASHIARILGIVNIRSSVKDFDVNERVTLQIDVNNPLDSNIDDRIPKKEVKKQDTIFLTEQGVMRLIFNSRKPEILEFKKWITQITKEVATRGNYVYEQQTRQALEANKKLVRRDRHNALVRAYEKNFVVYLIELEDFTPKYKDSTNPADTSRIIKIGSTKNIKTRLSGLKSVFGECTLIDCYKCVCYEDFENYLFKHEFIKPRFTQIIEGKRETYKFTDEEYSNVLEIIKNNINGFNNITIEEIVEKMRRDSELTNAAYNYKQAKEARIKSEQDRAKAKEDLIKSNYDTANAILADKSQTIKILAETEKIREAKNLKVAQLLTDNKDNPIMMAIINKHLKLMLNERPINVKASDFDAIIDANPALFQAYMSESSNYEQNTESINNRDSESLSEELEDDDQPELDIELDAEIEGEIEKHLETLNDAIISAEPPKAHDAYINVMNELNPIEPKSYKGPLVQQYDPHNMHLIKTFNGFIDAVREVNSTSAAGIRAAVKARSVYNGFRWFTIARDAEPVQYEIPPTVEIQRSRRGLIAMLDLDQAHILKVYDSVNSASKEQKFSSGAAISKAINSNTKSGNKFWRRWEDCNDEQQREYLEHNELPEVMEIASGSVKINQYHPISRTFIKTFNSMADITTNYQMSRTTLFKAIATQKPTKGFVWNYAEPREVLGGE